MSVRVVTWMEISTLSVGIVNSFLLSKFSQWITLQHKLCSWIMTLPLRYGFLG